MRLKSISVGGFKNLNYTTIRFNSNTIAVISPNNYGKSNLLEAIGFANDFIVAGPKMRLNMMSWKMAFHSLQALQMSLSVLKWN